MGRRITYDTQPASVVYANTTEVTASAATHDHTGQSFGAARGDRLVFAIIGHANTAFLSSVTIGGISATLVDRVANGTRIEIWVAAVPTGTSGTVSVTANNINWRSVVATYAGYDIISASATATSTDTVGTLNTSVSVSAYGVVIAGGFTSAAGSPGTATWTNVTEDSEYLTASTTQILTTASIAVTAAATVSPVCAGLLTTPVGVTASFR